MSGEWVRFGFVVAWTWLVALPREPAGHPAWTGAKAGVNLEEQQVAKFQSRHQGGLQGLQGFFGKKKS